VFALLRGYAAGMLDTERVAALRAEGHSFRAIAVALGASLGAVQRAVKRGIVEAEAVDDDDDMTAEDFYEAPERLPLELPVVSAGLELVTDYRGRPLVNTDGRLHGLVPRWLDCNGTPFGILDRYRFGCRLREEDEAGGHDAAERMYADTQRLLDEAGVCYDEARDRWYYGDRLTRGCPSWWLSVALRAGDIP